MVWLTFFDMGQAMAASGGSVETVLYRSFCVFRIGDNALLMLEWASGGDVFEFVKP